MEINLTLLENYFKKSNFPINIAIDSSIQNIPSLTIIKGSYEQHGGVKVFLSFSDFNDILLSNNILGENGLLKAELDLFHKEMKDGTGNRNKREQKMDDLIYGTLEKYLTQMLTASLGKIHFPEIVPLPKHKEMYFKGGH